MLYRIADIIEARADELAALETLVGAAVLCAVVASARGETPARAIQQM